MRIRISTKKINQENRGYKFIAKYSKCFEYKNYNIFFSIFILYQLISEFFLYIKLN
jgi:hypothetical protein